MKSKTADQRFWEKVDKSGDCWLWTASVTAMGYGQFRVSTTERVLAHVYAYRQLAGGAWGGLKLDHLCRVKRCVNPDHLEPVTQKENVLRGIGPTAVNHKKTHCLRGHEFTSANTYVRTANGKPIGRRCRTCLRPGI